MPKLRRQFGRLYLRDERDDEHPMRMLLGKPKQKRTRRFWNDNGWHGDQKDKPWCCAFAMLHYLHDGPVVQPQAPCLPPGWLYKESCKVDGLPDDEDGTTVRGVAKVAKKKGFIVSYSWAKTVEDVVNWLLYNGPVIAGTDWYPGMNTPNSLGRIVPEGGVLGGHAYVLNGVNVSAGRIRMKNSWGDWGNKGRAWLTIDDFAFLLESQGEACIAVEARR